MKYPLITIGIACYNAADTIVRAIEGARLQDYPNFEIVVVDDCSTDQSFQILSDYVHKHTDKIRIFRNNHNMGVAGTRNHIVVESRGEFIAFFDDDDDCDSKRLTIQYERIRLYELEVDTDNVVCFGSGKKVYPNGYETHFRAIGSEGRSPIGDDLVRYHLMMDRPSNVFYGSGTPSCSMMIRKATIESVGGFDENLRRVEDSDLCIRLGLSDTHFIGCPEEIICQYASDGADKNSRVGYESEVYIVDKYKDYLIKKNLYNYAKDWTTVRYFHFSNQKKNAILQVMKMMFKYPRLTFQRFLRAAPRRIAHEWKMKR